MFDWSKFGISKYYYADDDVCIINSDCHEILPQLKNIDALITDPPYGIDHPTDYKKRGRGKLAECKNYKKVIGDNEPFDPSLILSLKIPTLLFGADHYCDKLPIATGWVVWDKVRPDDLDQSSCELAWTNFIKGTRCFRFMWNGMLRASDEEIFHPT
ncbi:MAG: hypothetical protein WC389_12910, partial [Lutibacter sp.]